MRPHLDAEGREAITAVAAAAERGYPSPNAIRRTWNAHLTEALGAVQRLLAWSRGERSRTRVALAAFSEDALEWLFALPATLVVRQRVDDGIALAHEMTAVFGADEVLADVAVALAECGFRERAIAEIDASLARFPDRAWTVTKCAMAWRELGEDARAEGLLRRSLELARLETSMEDHDAERVALDGALQVLLPLLLDQDREDEARDLFRRHGAPLRLERRAEVVPFGAARTGRNDPCPCGSGKKYKRCCGAALTGAASAPDLNSLLPDLLSFSRLTASTRVRLSVPTRYAGRRFRDLEDDVEFATLMEWAALDYRDELGRTSVERYLDWRAPELEAEARRLLEGLAGSQLRLYEVREVRPGEGLTLLDLLTDRAVEVHERLGSQAAQRWDLLAARVFPVGDEIQLAGGVLSFPPLEKTPLLTALRTELERSRRAWPDIPEAEALALSAGVFQRHLFAMRSRPLPRLTNDDGEELIFSTARYDVRDAREVRRRLDEARVFEADEFEREYVWLDRKRGSQVLGQVKLTPKSLRLECNSRERLEKGRRLLDKLLGDVLFHRGDKFESAEQAVARTEARAKRTGRAAPGGRAPTGGDAGVPPEIRHQLEKQVCDDHYRGWADEPLPALGGRTPRDASHDPALRGQLVDLLRHMENTEAHAHLPGERYDFSWLWSELGVRPEG